MVGHSVSCPTPPPSGGVLLVPQGQLDCSTGVWRKADHFQQGQAGEVLKDFRAPLKEALGQAARSESGQGGSGGGERRDELRGSGCPPVSMQITGPEINDLEGRRLGSQREPFVIPARMSEQPPPQSFPALPSHLGAEHRCGRTEASPDLSSASAPGQACFAQPWTWVAQHWAWETCSSVAREEGGPFVSLKDNVKPQTFLLGSAVSSLTSTCPVHEPLGFSVTPAEPDSVWGSPGRPGTGCRKCGPGVFQQEFA